MVRPRESLTEWPRVMWTVRRLPWVMGPGSHSWWSWCKQHGSAQLRTTSAKESLSVWREIPEKFHFVWVHMQADVMTPEESETIWGLRPNSGYLNQSHLFSQSCKHSWRLVASPVTISDFFCPSRVCLCSRPKETAFPKAECRELGSLILGITRYFTNFISKIRPSCDFPLKIRKLKIALKQFGRQSGKGLPV